MLLKYFVRITVCGLSSANCEVLVESSYRVSLECRTLCFIPLNNSTTRKFFAQNSRVM